MLKWFGISWRSLRFRLITIEQAPRGGIAIGISWRSLRFRLIGWYVLLLLLSLMLFSVYIFFQFRGLQQAQQDNILQTAVSNARSIVDPGRFAGPSLRPVSGFPGVIQDLNRTNVQVRLLSREGKVTDSVGNLATEMPLDLPPKSGFVSLVTSDDRHWRIYSQSLNGRDGASVGWIQVGQPLFLINPEVSRLFAPILLGTLIALFLAVLGGLFLANQALRPIDQVTRTAQTISTEELSRRINYQGPPDEIGRLAKTLDHCSIRF